MDRDGVKLTEGGGSVIYGSNNGVTYAPGGLGVLPGNSSVPSDILYYHYRMFFASCMHISQQDLMGLICYSQRIYESRRE